jgi:hypothetical protein
MSGYPTRDRYRARDPLCLEYDYEYDYEYE